ncbi:DUF916 domain-containing protein [Levilactobacillus huananensis]|uniref:DUF916 domain-containing protein n=1 Tax=Levilactobacillus huananensis TaxID=2486019 RepID=UPI000F7AAB07|nr:DUF916 domain-containing protein [Levilactobacillus huananensis]
MKLQSKWAAFLVVALLTMIEGFSLSNPTIGAQADSNQKPASFTVAPELPADNVKRTNYFDFKVTPGQKRVLVLTVTNNANRTNTFDITPRIAATNTNGILDYGTNNTNAALPAQLKQIISPNKTKTVKVLGKHTVKVAYNFTAPAKPFKGLMLGGFTVAEHHVSRSSSKKATGVVAHVQYVIGLEFYNQAQRTQSAPTVKFYRAGYRLAQARPTLTLGMSNQTPELVGQGKLHATLTNDKQEKIMHFNKEQMTFAPQSQFKLNMDLQNKQLAAGRYTLAGTLTAKGGYSWNFQKTFTVTNAQVRDVKKNAANFGPRKTWKDYLMYIIVGLAILVLLYEFYKWLKKRRQAKKSA